MNWAELLFLSWRFRSLVAQKKHSKKQIFSLLLTWIGNQNDNTDMKAIDELTVHVGKMITCASPLFPATTKTTGNRCFFLIIIDITCEDETEM